MKYCGMCGVRLTGTPFCANCGAAVSDTEVLRDVAPPTAGAHVVGSGAWVSPPDGDPGARVRSRLVVALSAGAAVVVLAIVGGLFLVQANDTGVDPGPGAAPTPPTEAGIQEAFARHRAGVVRLDVQTCDGRGTGSGFFVDRRHVITAAHVVDGASHINASANGEPISVAVVGIDRGQDVALLRADSAYKGPVIKLGGTPAIGAAVAAIGFPRGDDITLTTGAVSALAIPTD